MLIKILIAIVLLGFIFLMIDLYMKNSEKDHLSFYESMSLTQLPIIILKIGQSDYNFLLDTGSTGCYINKKLIDNNTIPYLNTDKSTESIGIEGNPLILPLVTISLSTPKDIVMSQDFIVRDMSDAFSNFKVDIHGILGSDFFRKYKYIINFSELIAYKSRI